MWVLWLEVEESDGPEHLKALDLKGEVPSGSDHESTESVEGLAVNK
jgi:hypothetical protein